MATSSQYRQLLSDYGPPSLGYTQGTGNSQVPQSKYAELLAIIEELGKEIRPTYAGSKSAMERLKRGFCSWLWKDRSPLLELVLPSDARLCFSSRHHPCPRIGAGVPG
ncbi:cyclin-dependent kinase 2-associated protein 1 isoform X3 [Bubalus kerabau]|nr:cyclin-dependent kinase 2-associated protein 1 isoform X3 [Bubalus carabanensis]XP_055406427.1 cyclin-dependent kinase 2-associated protein 1 isoform X3 [Bubalus carabanensis]